MQRKARVVNVRNIVKPANYNLVRRSRNVFPPLPSYDDATKLPAVRVELREESQQQIIQEQRGELCTTALPNEVQVDYPLNYGIEHEEPEALLHPLQSEVIVAEPVTEGRISCEREIT